MAVDVSDIFSNDTKKIIEATENIQTILWTEDQDITFDDASPAKGVEGKGSIDLAANGYKKVVVQISIAFAASIDGDAEIRIRKSTDSGTTKDTILAAGSCEITYDAGETELITLEFNEIPWLEIGVYNGTSTAGEITISAKYAGLKYIS